MTSDFWAAHPLAVWILLSIGAIVLWHVAYWIRQGYLEKAAPPKPTVRERIPQDVKSKVWRRDRGQCVRCGAFGPGARLEFGHIIPWSKGGSDTANNLQILCLPCNRREGNRI